LVVPRADLAGGFIDAGAVRLLERAVDKATAGPAAENRRAWTLQDLDTLRVVEIAEILDVVAKTVDEEVGTGVDAADHEFVAIAFALVDGDAGNVAGDLGEGLKTLVADKILGHDRDGLRNVDQRRVGLGRNRRAVGVDAGGAGPHVLRFAEWLRLDLGLRPGGGLRAATRCGAVRTQRIGGAGGAA